MTKDQQETGSAGTQPEEAGLPDRADVDPHDLEQLEIERAERLNPTHRPGNAEVDNTDRTFDPAAGRFTDDPQHDPQEQPYADGEDAP